ncbi:MAG: hypothetical protein ACXITV_00965 [Luteibaculaceae bacterium]
MKAYTIGAVLLVLIFSSCNLQKKTKVGEVSVAITQTKSYCGGAPPDAPILKELSTPKPLAQESFVIRSGSVNKAEEKIVASFTTDKQGEAFLSLPPGDYLIVEAYKKDRAFFNKLLMDFEHESENYSKVNVECLMQWLETPLLTFTVEDTREPLRLTVNMLKPCDYQKFPCVHFIGPLPPGAPPQ